jgi:hypothetical protein
MRKLGRKVKEALAIIDHMSAPERAELFDELFWGEHFFATGYSVLPNSVMSQLVKTLQRKRGKNPERRQRGLIIQAEHSSGVLWKNMLGYICDKYPDWFPELETSGLRKEEKKRWEERLRKMARDATKPDKS